jgi:hypothetical protein
MEIDESDEQPQNVSSARQERREPVSKVIRSRDLHPSKQASPSVSTEEGMQMKEGDFDHAKAERSIQERVE